jgi:pimeloyl-ACP methyl ester carboxylesterase
MALEHPEAVAGAVLVSGYYYPTPRVDALALSGPGTPVLGDALRFTVSPLLARLLWPGIMRKMFGPAPRSAAFEAAIKEMALRPSQIRASAVESGLLIPGAIARKDYATLTLPVAIVVGTEDRIVDAKVQSVRLHEAVAQSTLRRVPGAGHMVHHAAPEAVMEAVDDVAAAARAEPREAVQTVG